MNEAPLGDMPPDEFRKYGHQLIEWIADYLENTDRYPVLSRLEPGELKAQIPTSPPDRGEPMDQILKDFEQTILPGITHWNHPSFFSYFSITGSGPGILGELLCAAFNVNAMLWKTSPAATELEEVTLDWFRQMLGLPEDFWGIIYDTASISTLHAIAAAREAVPGLNAREEGLGASRSRLRMYTSEHSHSSVEKAAITLGIGKNGVKKIPVDSAFRMDPKALETAIRMDLESGWLPFCVVATVGTTSTTSVDPVAEIARISKRFNLWLHVDAAYAGPAAILPEMRWVLEGCESADSIVTNPHKWLFTPIDLSAFFCRKPETVKNAFSLVPEYLKTSVDDAVTNFMDYGVQLGRRFRALKLWMVIRYFGREGLAARIRQHLSWAQEFAGKIDDSPRFQRMAPTPFSTICFRAVPETMQTAAPELIDKLNAELLDAVNRTGKTFLSHTKLNDRFTLRLAIGNLKTREEHLERTWELLQQELDRLEEGGITTNSLNH